MQSKNKTQPKVKPFLLPLQSMTSQQFRLPIWNLKACHVQHQFHQFSKISPLGGLFVFFGTLWVYLVAVLSFFNQHLGPNSPWNPPDNIQLSPWKLMVGRWTFQMVTFQTFVHIFWVTHLVWKSQRQKNQDRPSWQPLDSPLWQVWQRGLGVQDDGDSKKIISKKSWSFLKQNKKSRSLYTLYIVIIRYILIYALNDF